MRRLSRFILVLVALSAGSSRASGAPDVVTCFALDDAHVVAKFDVAVTSASANDPANYALGSGSTIHSAVRTLPNIVILTITSSLSPGDLESLTIANLVADSTLAMMGAPQTRYFHHGVVSVADVQAPDPGALADTSCEDRSRFAGPGGGGGAPVTVVGVCVAPWNDYSQVAMHDTTGPGPRKGLFVDCPSLRLYPGTVYRFTGRIEERGGQTRMRNVIHRDSLYVTPRRMTDYLTAVRSPSMLNETSCDASQSIFTGEDYEGALVRLVGLRVWRADPENEMFVVGPVGSPADTVGVVNLNVMGHYAYDAGTELNLTGVVVERDGRFFIAPRGHDDIELGKPDFVYHGMYHWIFGPGLASVHGVAPHDTLRVVGLAGDGRDGLRVRLPQGTQFWTGQMKIEQNVFGAPSDIVNIEITYREKQGDPIEMVQAKIEGSTKAKNLATGVIKADPNQTTDTQDVTNRVNANESARTKKKLGGAIVSNGGDVVEEVDLDSERDTIQFSTSEAAPGFSPLFTAIDVAVENRHLKTTLRWDSPLTLSITRNQDVVTAVGDELVVQQTEALDEIEALTDIYITLRDAASISLMGERVETLLAGNRDVDPIHLRTRPRILAPGTIAFERTGPALGFCVQVVDVRGRLWWKACAEPGRRSLVWRPGHGDVSPGPGIYFARIQPAGGAPVELLKVPLIDVR
jgi:hypothetical protein